MATFILNEETQEERDVTPILKLMFSKNKVDYCLSVQKQWRIFH